MEGQLAEAARQLHAATQARDKAVAHAKHLAQQARQQGHPENWIAEQLGVTRTTIRRWLGKN